MVDVLLANSRCKGLPKLLNSCFQLFYISGFYSGTEILFHGPPNIFYWIQVCASCRGVPTVDSFFLKICLGPPTCIYMYVWDPYPAGSDVPPDSDVG